MNDQFKSLTSQLISQEVSVVKNELRPGNAIAIVGEAPGEHELEEGKPFVGFSGQLLWDRLANVGILRSNVSALNVSQHQVFADGFPAWDDPILSEDRAQLDSDIAWLKPNIVLCLGPNALYAACDEPRSLSLWRGSVFWSKRWNCKVIASFAPSSILRVYSNISYYSFDFRKLAIESKTPIYTPTQYDHKIAPTLEEVVSYLSHLETAKPRVALDIEGYVHNIRCIAFATDATHGFCIPFTNDLGEPYWSVDDECVVWDHLRRVLSDVTIPKILQNFLYDGFCLAYGAQAPIRGLADDTMLKHWELLPEMEKGLDVQASLWTNTPYYKGAKHSPDGKDLWYYCCTDAAITFEINDKLTPHLTPEAQHHYAFNLALLAILNHMQLRGVRIDLVKREQLRTDLKAAIYSAQDAIDQSVIPWGCYTPLPATQADLVQLIASIVCYKKYEYTTPESLLSAPKAPWATTIARIVDLATQYPNITSAQRGELDTLLERQFNVDSNKQMQVLLYDKLALPKIYKKEHGKTTSRVTCDALALLTLAHKSPHPILLKLLELRNKIDSLGGLDFEVDPDNRCRSGYNVVGTETGRVACYNSALNTGKSIQIETSKHKCIYVPDNDDMWIAELDLSGADGWTVAAHCAALGDTTMLEDYRYGIKPAKVIAIIYEHGAQYASADRDTLRKMCKQVSQKGWLYFACKRVQHGTNYGMQSVTMSDTILRDSWNKEGELIFVEPRTCGNLQIAYCARYNAVRRWHTQSEHNLISKGYLVGASGHKRVFFGRRKDLSTFKEYLADEPQENTTFATNTALLRLWTDPTNHRDGYPIVEPLFHRHDAFGVQFHKRDTDYAVTKLREWFQNPITIAGQQITIPAEGGYGPSWGQLDNEI